MPSQPFKAPDATSGALEHLQPQSHRLLRRPPGFPRFHGANQVAPIRWHRSSDHRSIRGRGRRNSIGLGEQGSKPDQTKGSGGGQKQQRLEGQQEQA